MMQQQQNRFSHRSWAVSNFFTGEMTPATLVLKLINKYTHDHGVILLIWSKSTACQTHTISAKTNSEGFFLFFFCIENI